MCLPAFLCRKKEQQKHRLCCSHLGFRRPMTKGRLENSWESGRHQVEWGTTSSISGGPGWGCESCQHSSNNSDNSTLASWPSCAPAGGLWLYHNHGQRQEKTSSPLVFSYTLILNIENLHHKHLDYLQNYNLKKNLKSFETQKTKIRL